jgi:hypothetical protein
LTLLTVSFYAEALNQIVDERKFKRIKKSKLKSWLAESKNQLIQVVLTYEQVNSQVLIGFYEMVSCYGSYTSNKQVFKHVEMIFVLRHF